MKKTITLAVALALSSASMVAAANTLEIRGTVNFGYSQHGETRIDFDQATYVIELSQKPTMPLVYAASTWRQYSDALEQVSLSITDVNGNAIVANQPLAASAAITPTNNTFYIDYGRYTDFASWTLNGITADGFNSQTKLNLQGPRTYLFASTAEFPRFISSPMYVNATLSSSVETADGDTTIYFQGLISTITEATQDSDGDGVLDDVDSCPASDLNPTVLVGANDSGVTNSVDGAGCSIADQVNACFVEASHHGDSVSCVSHLATNLRKSGVISGRDQGSLLRSL